MFEGDILIVQDDAAAYDTVPMLLWYCALLRLRAVNIFAQGLLGPVRSEFCKVQPAAVRLKFLQTLVLEMNC